MLPRKPVLFGLAALGAASLFAIPLIGQPPADTPAEASPAVPPGPRIENLPLKSVVLFNAGIGYFYREGQVNGPVKVNVKVNEEDVNDLILTLLSNDPEQPAQAITYDNKAPAEITLKAFQIDLTENPSLGGLLMQVRGEVANITDATNRVLTGQIVGVERPEAGLPSAAMYASAGGNVKDETELLSVLTEEGLQTLPLGKITKVKFTREALQKEFRAALSALASAHGSSSKSVDVLFPGQGQRKVSLGYMTEASLWKPAYRVVLGKDSARLKGFASIENVTDEDWNNVNIKLVSGRPITFKMDLYDPLFVPRPTVEPELYASLRPVMYAGPATAAGALPQMALNTMNSAGNLGQLGFGGGGFGGSPGANLGVGGGVLGMTGGNMYSNFGRPSVRSLLKGEQQQFQQQQVQEQPNSPTEPTTGGLYGPGPLGINQPNANLGESFEYIVKEPITLPRYKSAMVPIIDEAIQVKKLSLYTASTLQKHPLLGVQLTNSTKLPIAQGPVAVFDNDTVAGQARLADVKPGATRLLSYAIDLDTIMEHKVESDTQPLTAKLSPGLFEHTFRTRTTRTVKATNLSAEAKTLWITEQIPVEHKLIAPEKPVEKIDALNRFELIVGPGETKTLEIISEDTFTRSTRLIDFVVDGAEAKTMATFPELALDNLLKDKSIPAAVMATLKFLEKERTGLRENTIQRLKATELLAEISADQERLRANMERVPKESEAFMRYLKKFDVQETQIEQQQGLLKTLATQREERMVELNKAIEQVKTK
jgi:hypothetical protein